jgi:hypothetical protein
MATENENGNAASGLEFSQIVLTLKRDTFQLEVDGTTENLYEALAMLGMATFYLEAHLRAVQLTQVVSGPMPVSIANLRARH